MKSINIREIRDDNNETLAQSLIKDAIGEEIDEDKVDRFIEEFSSKVTKLKKCAPRKHILRKRKNWGFTFYGLYCMIITNRVGNLA